MTTEDEDSKPGNSDSGKPARPGQFRKGRSGNPNGRPRKATPEAKPERNEARFPQREFLKAERERKVKITDENGPSEITMDQLIVRSALTKAVKGSVYALRMVKDWTDKEDERIHNERKRSYDLWSDYKERESADLEAARKAGLDEPDLCPHPDDIILNWATLEVQFLGSLDDEGHALQKEIADALPLLLEMSIFLGEDNQSPGPANKAGRLGLFAAMFCVYASLLPPRLRAVPDRHYEQILQRRLSNPRGGEKYLQDQCRHFGVPFIPYKDRGKARTFSFAELGITGHKPGARR